MANTDTKDTGASPDVASNKRKADDSLNNNSKKGKTAGDQKTIEETFQTDTDSGHHNDGSEHSQSSQNTKKALESQNGNGEKPSEEKSNRGKEDNDSTSHAAVDDGAIEEEKGREDTMPSNILEKGIIYFFTRGRVGVEDPDSVTDLQRSHFVLRPIPDGAKIGDGTINDMKNARLVALPKKVWPKSGKDRFMAFVESANASVKELKDDFLQGSEYETKTLGTRHTPPVTPVGEGVYAITSTGEGRESHLAYMLTIPDQPGKLQADIGIREKGSFVISLKNPEVKGPANASLPQKPEWPKEFIDEFRNRSWMPVHPKHLDYANAQMLLIGEDIESGHALDETKKDEKDNTKKTPKEEMEKLEDEDQIRVRHLKGDDTIYADLGISKKEYPAVATTW